MPHGKKLSRLPKSLNDNRLTLAAAIDELAT